VPAVERQGTPVAGKPMPVGQQDLTKQTAETRLEQPVVRAATAVRRDMPAAAPQAVTPVRRAPA
jgi:hypothetical protein